MKESHATESNTGQSNAESNTSRYLFYSSVLILCIVYGMAAEKYKLFPSPMLHSLVDNAKLAVGELWGDSKTWYYVDAKTRKQVPVYKADEVQPGLTLITGLGAERSLVMKVINFNGDVVNQWDLDWHKIWPDATHLSPDVIPRGKPGTHIHGSTLMDNGDIIFNFEHLGLVRLDTCGNTVFRVPYSTHHAVNVDDQGNIWTPGEVVHTELTPEYPNYLPPYKEATVAEISPQGELLRTISLMALLKDNGYEGLMNLSTLVSRKPRVKGDVYHLNDVEVFPKSLPEGVFKHGDVMVSMRNINTVLVFDPQSLKIRFVSTGQFVRQHDPDFIDGNRFSVYDNNLVAAKGAANNHSKIVIVSALDGSVTPYFKGSNAIPFYSYIMGKHQWLDNGNLLMVESMNGRALELNPQGQLVWEYNNLIAQKGVVGIMEGTERLAPMFDESFFAQRRAACTH
ncbi:MAG: hypothetical protein ACI8WB_002651 [Phenylobacterium sp.]